MDAWETTHVLLLLTLVPSSHQWTSHGSIQFLSEGESTLLEAPGDSSAGCWWFFTHPDHPLHSCCFPSHDHLCDQNGAKSNKCRKMEDAEVRTEVDGVPACTLTLRNLTEAGDKGNYQAIFPADLTDGLEVSLWIFPTPDPVDQSVRKNHPGLYNFKQSVMFCLFRATEKVLGLGGMPSSRCQPAQL